MGNQTCSQRLGDRLVTPAPPDTYTWLPWLKRSVDVSSNCISALQGSHYALEKSSADPILRQEILQVSSSRDWYFTCFITPQTHQETPATTLKPILCEGHSRLTYLASGEKKHITLKRVSVLPKQHV